MSGPTDPAEAHFDKGSWGWDLTQWRKLPLVFGYTDRWVEQQSDLNADAGTNSLQTVAVPSGYVYRVDCIVTMNVDKVVTQLKRVVGGGVEVEIAVDLAAGAATHISLFPVGLWLKVGDYVKVYFLDCNAGDDLYLEVWGIKMAIAE